MLKDMFEWLMEDFDRQDFDKIAPSILKKISRGTGAKDVF